MSGIQHYFGSMCASVSTRLTYISRIHRALAGLCSDTRPKSTEFSCFSRLTAFSRGVGSSYRQGADAAALGMQPTGLGRGTYNHMARNTAYMGVV